MVMINANLKVSVVIPTCDRHDQVLDAISSLDQQTFKPSECIVVDNGIKPVTNAFLGCYSFPIKLIRTKPKIGPSAARNVGVRFSEGSYIAFLDDDDIWVSDYLEKMVKKILRFNAEVVVSRLYFYENEIKDSNFVFDRVLGSLRKDQRKLFYSNPGVSGQNIVICKNLFNLLGGFDEKMFCTEDRDLGARLILSNKKIYVEPRAVVKVLRGGGVSKGMVKGNVLFLKKYWNFMTLTEKLFSVQRILKFWISLSAKSLRLV